VVFEEGELGLVSVWKRLKTGELLGGTGLLRVDVFW
jgi:hypothetical protein